jgi:hypothetical protein
MKIKHFIFFAILLSSNTCFAAIYKCVVNGTIMFSESPCGDESEEIDLTPPPVLKHNSHTSYGSSVKNMVGYVKIDEFKRDIQILERRIDYLNQQKTADLQNIEKEVILARQQKMDKNQIKIAKQKAVMSINKLYKNKIYSAKRKISKLKKDISIALNKKVQTAHSQQTNNKSDAYIDRVSQKQKYIKQIRQVEKQIKSLEKQLIHQIRKVKQKQVSGKLSATSKMQLSVELDLTKKKYRNMISQQKTKLRKLQIKKLQVN